MFTFRERSRGMNIPPSRLEVKVPDEGTHGAVGEGKDQPHGKDWPNDVLTRQCVAAGVTVVPPHGLRGTVASWSKEVGVIGAAISRDLGHNGQAVTNRHYVKADAGGAARTRQIASTLAPVKKEKRRTKMA
jgi:integrase